MNRKDVVTTRRELDEEGTCHDELSWMHQTHALTLHSVVTCPWMGTKRYYLVAGDRYE